MDLTSFESEQEETKKRIRSGEVDYVFLDPDNSAEDWLMLAIRRRTGVVYEAQCAGILTQLRLVEGFLIPLGGWKYEIEPYNKISLDSFYGIFHDGDVCHADWFGGNMPPDRFKILNDLVETIPCWRSSYFDVSGSPNTREPLHIDQGRLGELAEGWIPVETPHGPGVLLYKNCD